MATPGLRDLRIFAQVREIRMSPAKRAVAMHYRPVESAFPQVSNRRGIIDNSC
jgi:hypothetical protein